MSFLPVLLIGLVGLAILWLWDQMSSCLRVERFESKDGQMTATIRWKSRFRQERRCEVRRGVHGWVSSSGSRLSTLRSEKIDAIIERRKRCEWLREKSQNRSSRCGSVSHLS